MMMNIILNVHFMTLFLLFTLLHHLTSHLWHHGCLLLWWQCLEGCQQLLIVLLLQWIKHSLLDWDWLSLQLGQGCLFFHSTPLMRGSKLSLLDIFSPFYSSLCHFPIPWLCNTMPFEENGIDDWWIDNWRNIHSFIGWLLWMELMASFYCRRVLLIFGCFDLIPQMEEMIRWLTWGFVHWCFGASTPMSNAFETNASMLIERLL